MTDFTHSLAILIGIDAYTGGIPPLTTAVSDAARLAELLQAAHGYETILLTGEAAGPPVTRERLRKLFAEELKARLGDDDRLLVYFAGHGVALDGDDGPRGYLVPQDARPGDSASMLAMTDLHAWLTALPCRHMLAILDCCFAGAFRWAATRHIGALPDVIHQERYDRYLRSPAWQVLTSAAYDQKALDVLDGKTIGVRESDGTPHSPFAQALIDALEKGAADLVPKGQGDGVITATELYLYLRQQVEVQAEAQAGHEQTPTLWPLNKHRKGEFIFLAPGHPLNLPPAPDLTEEANPYRGLKSYDQKHAPLFFGREDEIDDLVQRVDQQPFLAVLGASGTGKSSLVKAGLLPRLAIRSDDFSRPTPAGATEVATTNAAYRVLLPMRPTDDPMQALAALLQSELDEDPSGFRNPKGLGGDDALAEAIACWAAAHPGHRLVLAIDQFEELATLCRDDGERERFLRLLANAVQAQPDAFRLILTLRTDFEPQFTQKDSPLAAIWGAGRYVVPPMDIEDLRQVIEGPASVRVLYFDPPELVDDLIKEVIQTPGALPLLSFTLSELYVKYVRSGRDDRALSVADYRALGGVVGSLRNRATEEYDRLPDDAHRATMQRAMLRMVSVEGGELARRRVALSELEYPTAEENARVQTVLDRLVDARLLVRGTSDPSPGSGQVPDGAKGEAYVEPAHDALVLAWDKLLRWKQEAEEYLPLQRRLAQAAGEWRKAATEAKTGLLWDDDPRLPQVEETLWPTGGKRRGLAGRARWAKQVLSPKTEMPADTKWLNGAEFRFAQASVSRRASTFRRIIGITAAVMIALTGLAIFASYQANQATTERDNALQAQQTAVAESNARATEVVVRATAEANAERSAQAEATAAADARLRQAEAERQARSSQAGELAARGQIELGNPFYDPSLALLLARQAVLTTWPTDGYVVPAADSALQAAIDRASLSRWIATFEHDGEVTDVAFSPDSRHLASGNLDGTVRIWDWITKQELPRLIGHEAAIRSVTYSSDNAFILTASEDKTARIWDTSSGQEITYLSNPGSEVLAAAFSPDGQHVVTADADGLVLIWKTQTWKTAGQLSGHDGPIVSVAYSHDGAQILTAGADGTARTWDVVSGQEIRRLSGHVGVVMSASYSPIVGVRGLQIVTAGEDGTARVWDATTGEETLQLDGHIANVWSAAYSPDGKHIITASADQTARIWDAMTGAELRQLWGHTDWVLSATFSQDGERIATASRDGSVRIWDSSPAPPQKLDGHDDIVWSTAYSDDGKYVVTASWDNTARMWDAATRQELRRFKGHTEPVLSAAFSPDGRFVVTASEDNTARIWDATTGREVRQLTGHARTVWSAAYSPNGQHIITASADETVRIWDATTGQELQTLGNHESIVRWAAYSPDGVRIATAGEDGTVRIWDSVTGVELLRFNGRTAAVFAANFNSNGRLVVSAGADQTARVWDALTGREIQPLTGHSAQVLSAAFSPDDRQVVTASADGTVRIWDWTKAHTIRQLGGLPTHIFTSVAYSPDGKTIMAASSDFTVKIWVADIDELMAEGDGLIQRVPPELTPGERQRFGLD